MVHLFVLSQVAWILFVFPLSGRPLGISPPAFWVSPAHGQQGIQRAIFSITHADRMTLQIGEDQLCTYYTLLAMKQEPGRALEGAEQDAGASGDVRGWL